MAPLPRRSSRFPSPHRSWLPLVLLVGPNVAPGADTITERLDTTVSLRSDIWSGSRGLDDAGVIGQVSAWGRAKLDLNAAGVVSGSAWLREQNRTHQDRPRGRVRELYWRYNKEPVELRIGRQMVVWGRADGVNPTDNLSPRDFTLLAPEDGDLRYGNEVAQLSLNTSAGNFAGLFFPHAASHTIPLSPQPNVSYAVEKPHQSQWALKWEANGDGIDGSISYLHGIDPMPDINPGGTGPGGVTIAIRNHPARILGADLTLTHKGVVWRAEAAWMQTDSSGKNDFTRKKPQVALVAGPEWTLADSTTLGVQGTLQRVMGFQNSESISDPTAREIASRQLATSNQTAPTQVGMTWRLARRWWNDTLQAEISGIAVWPSGSGVWRTKVDYALSDHWYLQAGGDYYFGTTQSYFGQLRKNRLAYVQLRYSFAPL